jgi:hypothetical protein
MSKDRVYIKEVQQDLEFLAKRSAIRWCHNNNVRIFIDKGSKEAYVLRFEYERAKRMDERRRESVIAWNEVKMSQIIYIDDNGKVIHRTASKDSSVS